MKSRNKFNTLRDILSRIYDEKSKTIVHKKDIPKVPNECVFCGKKPEKKTKEHVIPQWLIGLTGNKKREMFLTISKFADTETKKHNLPFDQFVFPACKKCNNGFATLEGKVKVVFEKILSKHKVNQTEVENLLDWFDKVRVGLWLAGLMWSNNKIGIKPNYRIVERLSKTDRLLYVGYTEKKKMGLNFSNITDLIFLGNPLFIFLRVNNFCFVNLAGIGIAGASMGLPKIKIPKTDGVKSYCEIKRPKSYCYRENWPAAPKGFTILSQAIYRHLLSNVNLDTEFFGGKMIDKNKSKIGLHINGKFKFMEEEEETLLGDSFVSFEVMLKKTIALYIKLRKFTANHIANSIHRRDRAWIKLYKEFASLTSG
jgi:hypothetical protein